MVGDGCLPLDCPGSVAPAANERVRVAQKRWW